MIADEESTLRKRKWIYKVIGVVLGVVLFVWVGPALLACLANSRDARSAESLYAVFKALFRCAVFFARRTTSRWTDHGKILHMAKSKDKEQAHTASISDFRPKFRLTQLEPEIAYIDQAELTVELNHGRSLALTASDPRLSSRDGRYAVLRMGEEMDFEFKLPNGVKKSDVGASRLRLLRVHCQFRA